LVCLGQRLLQRLPCFLAFSLLQETDPGVTEGDDGGLLVPHLLAQLMQTGKAVVCPGEPIQCQVRVSFSAE
jgi:hypothetical protein